VTFVDTQELNSRITKLRADGSEGALELATELERQAEQDAPEKLGVDPDAQPQGQQLSDGSVRVEGTPVETPEAPPLPEEPQIAEAPPTAEERLADAPPIDPHPATPPQE